MNKWEVEWFSVANALSYVIDVYQVNMDNCYSLHDPELNS